MALLSLILLVVVLVAVVTGIIMAVKRINVHAEARYSFRPISWGRTFMVVVPLLLLPLAQLLDLSGCNYNLAAALLLLISVVVGIFLWIKSKTNLRIALTSTALLIIIGLVLATFIALIIIIFLTRGEKHNTQLTRPNSSP